MGVRSLDGFKQYTTAFDTQVAYVFDRYPRILNQLRSNFLLSCVKCPLWQRKNETAEERLASLQGKSLGDTFSDRAARTLISCGPS